MGRKIPEPNNASLADIAFMLLIFFLVTTTMDVDSGIPRILPQPVPDDAEKPPPVKERNVFIVLLNANNQLLVEGELMDVRDLKDRTKEFILNPAGREDLSEKKEKEVPFFGTVMVSKGVVSLQNDRGTEYKKYIEVQNELFAAFNELKEGLSQKEFGMPYNKLSKDKEKAIREIFPLAISEAEPRNIGK